MQEFIPFQKIPRLFRDCTITEKLDGTSGCISITDDGEFLIGSRSCWITPEHDNYGFARWATANREELIQLGPGQHFGEWWGSGIQRGYGLKGGDKRFSLFNVGRWGAEGVELPKCVGLVPVLYAGLFSQSQVEACLVRLRMDGSSAAPGFMKPEGIIVYHEAARHCFKITLEKDEAPKCLSTTSPSSSPAPSSLVT